MEQWVAEEIENEIIERISKLDEIVLIHVDNLIKKNLNFDDIDSIIDSYFEPDYDDFKYHDRGIFGN